jgi:hypothetical protein
MPHQQLTYEQDTIIQALKNGIPPVFETHSDANFLYFVSVISPNLADRIEVVFIETEDARPQDMRLGDFIEVPVWAVLAVGFVWKDVAPEDRRASDMPAILHTEFKNTIRTYAGTLAPEAWVDVTGQNIRCPYPPFFPSPEKTRAGNA